MNRYRIEWLTCQSLPSEALAKYVLEIKGGLSDEWQLEVGDQIEFEKTN